MQCREAQNNCGISLGQFMICPNSSRDDNGILFQRFSWLSTKLGLFRLDSQLFEKDSIALEVFLKILHKVFMVPEGWKSTRFSQVLLKLRVVEGFGEDAFEEIDDLLRGPRGDRDSAPHQLNCGLIAEFLDRRNIGELRSPLGVRDGNRGDQFPLHGRKSLGNKWSRAVHVPSSHGLNRRGSTLIGSPQELDACSLLQLGPEEKVSISGVQLSLFPAFLWISVTDGRMESFPIRAAAVEEKRNGKA